ncbi:hypothetical protein CKALI_01735 [Corynebacterium kalinowskii]|uniref:DUF4247 domain-containing protein n=1 Tax=Corynebacterium kalinowskii TaxID=2675216 RepID=A0A6B8VR57_9CORY|nr:DUF4247 domain-containing protein [Corynebacterium kalinowskii]QGU01246.1 hypothetical protein CKALI_01735 [Corynebacterium kalinowskii]
MNPHSRRILGGFFVFLSVFSLIGALVIGPTPKSGTYSNARYGQYECQGDPQKVANEIAAKDKPQARQFDPKTGTEYLKYRKRLVSVSKEGPTGCRITVENLDRVNGGGLIWLGPGFSPGSPSGSSGGSSGSGGSGTGVK